MSSIKKMRRKLKYGIYTNRTMKKLHYDLYCSVCLEDIHKHCYLTTFGQEFFCDCNHKIHQYGAGSLLPGKKFVQFNKLHSKKYREIRNERQTQAAKKRLNLKKLGSEELNYYLNINSHTNKSEM